MTLISSISGIRGTIGGFTGDSLTPLDIVRFTSAYANFIKENSSNKKIVIGRDARMSGEMFRTSFPKHEEFSKFIDPKFSSNFWKRVSQ